jgi:hypothetical protein
MRADGAEPPEYAYVRAIIDALAQSRVRRGVDPAAAKAEVERWIGAPPGSLARWQANPGLVPLGTGRMMAIVCDRAARDTEVEADEAIGLQLRVVTARAIAAHTVALRPRYAGLVATEAAAALDADLRAILTASPPPPTPEVNQGERDAVERAVLAADERDLERLTL